MQVHLLRARGKNMYVMTYNSTELITYDWVHHLKLILYVMHCFEMSAIEQKLSNLDQLELICGVVQVKFETKTRSLVQTNCLHSVFSECCSFLKCHLLDEKSVGLSRYKLYRCWTGDSCYDHHSCLNQHGQKLVCCLFNSLAARKFVAVFVFVAP